jgi:DNA modification methylase
MGNAPRYDTEFIWALQKKSGLKWFNLGKTTMTYKRLTAGCVAVKERILNDDKTAFHPTQKPIAVMEWLLSVEGESVFDPFMGLGTTGIAAINKKMSFVGIEREERYFEVAKRRIAEAQMQLSLQL